MSSQKIKWHTWVGENSWSLIINTWAGLRVIEGKPSMRTQSRGLRLGYSSRCYDKNARQSAWKGCCRLLGTSWQQAWGSRSQCTHAREREWCVMGLSVLLLTSQGHQPVERCHQHIRWVSPRGSFSENTPQTHPQVYSLGDNEALCHRSPYLKGRDKGGRLYPKPSKNPRYERGLRGHHRNMVETW